jgi:hypothetical protein
MQLELSTLEKWSERTMVKKIDFIKNLAVFKDFSWDKSVIDGNGQPIAYSGLNRPPYPARADHPVR